MESITDRDFTCTKRVSKDSELKDFGECFDLYVQSVTVLLPDTFNTFCNMIFEIYKIHPVHFLSVQG